MVASVETMERRGMELPRLTLDELAERLGIPRNTLVNYQLGRRAMPPAVRRRIAAEMRCHAAALERAAKRLERAG